MNKLASLTIGFVLWSGFAVAAPVLDEDTVIAIRAEMTTAVANADLAPFEKYLCPESKIVVDLDPSLSSGETEIGYEEYMAMLEMAFPLLQKSEIHEELLSISIDEDSNQATVKDKTTATLDMMGLKIRDVTVSETTFGVVNGEIKVLVAREQLISSGPM